MNTDLLGTTTDWFLFSTTDCTCALILPQPFLQSLGRNQLLPVYYLIQTSSGNIKFLLRTFSSGKSALNKCIRPVKIFNKYLH